MSNAAQGVISQDLRSLRRLELKTGSAIEFKSADNYNALRGVGIDMLVIDEATLRKREAL